jgi:hypothetical protein
MTKSAAAGNALAPPGESAPALTLGSSSTPPVSGSLVMTGDRPPIPISPSRRRRLLEYEGDQRPTTPRSNHFQDVPASTARSLLLAKGPTARDPPIWELREGRKGDPLVAHNGIIRASNPRPRLARFPAPLVSTRRCSASDPGRTPSSGRCRPRSPGRPSAGSPARKAAP